MQDGINLQKLLQNPPPTRKPQEQGYELPKEGETNTQIRDRNLRNQEKRVIWENQCLHLDSLGPKVDGVPCAETDIKCRSYIYLCLGAKGKRDFWERLKRLFVSERNVTFDRYEAFKRKQGRTETLEQHHCILTELVVKGSFKCLNYNDGDYKPKSSGTCLLQTCLRMRCRKIFWRKQNAGAGIRIRNQKRKKFGKAIAFSETRLNIDYSNDNHENRTSLFHPEKRKQQ